MDGSRGNNRLEKHKYTRICGHQDQRYVHDILARTVYKRMPKFAGLAHREAEEASLAREENLEAR